MGGRKEAGYPAILEEPAPNQVEPAKVLCGLLPGRCRRHLTVIACLLLAAGSARPAVAEGLSADECWTTTLRQSLGWVRSAIWSVSGDELLVVDTLNRSNRDQRPTQKLLALSERGQLLSDSHSLYPSAALRTAFGSYFLENSRGYEILRLDDRWERVGSTSFRAATRDGNDQQTAIYDWLPTGDGGFLAFGALRRSDQGPRELRDKALLYFDQAGIQQIFYRLEAGSEERWHYYSTETPYLATLERGMTLEDGTTLEEDRGYMLFLREEPAIGEVIRGRDGVHELPFFPDDFRSRPRFERQKHWTGPERSTRFLKTLENSKTAMGLYSWGGSLYLLAKKAITRDRETAWWLIKLDPRTGVESGRVRLPTTAAHLSIVPGDFWALIEKGPVAGIGPYKTPYRRTDSMVLVPADWLEDPHAGRLHAERRVACEPLAQ